MEFQDIMKIEEDPNKEYTYDPSAKPPPFGHKLKPFWALDPQYLNLNHGDLSSLAYTRMNIVLMRNLQVRMDHYRFQYPQPATSCTCYPNGTQICSIARPTDRFLSKRGV